MGQIMQSTGDTVVDDNMEFLVFEDGSQCNVQLIGEWVVPIDSINDAPYVEEPSQLLVDRGGEVKRVDHSHQNTERAQETVKAPVSITNPVHELLKISKKKTVKLQFTFEVEMPPEDLIRVVNDSYDNGIDTMCEYLISTANHDKVLEQMNAAVREKIVDVTKKRRTTK